MGAVPGVLVLMLLPPHMEQALVFLGQLGVIAGVSSEEANATRLLDRCLVLPMVLSALLQLLALEMVLRRRRESRLDVLLLADRSHTCTIEGRDIVAVLLLLLVTARQLVQVLLEQSMVAVRLLLLV